MSSRTKSPARSTASLVCASHVKIQYLGHSMKGYVQAYRNLNKKLSRQLGNGIDPKVVGNQPVYSIRGDDGLVKKHLCHFVLWDCTLRVGKKGKQRVRNEKRKNVHAFVRGNVIL